MVSLQWSEKLTNSYFSHSFLFDHGACLLILPYPDSHREAPNLSFGYPINCEKSNGK